MQLVQLLIEDRVHRRYRAGLLIFGLLEQGNSC